MLRGFVVLQKYRVYVTLVLFCHIYIHICLWLVGVKSIERALRADKVAGTRLHTGMAVAGNRELPVTEVRG